VIERRRAENQLYYGEAMERLDLFYSALGAYLKSISDDKESSALKAEFKRASSEKDGLVFDRTYCVIESDWVLEIEKELVYLEKAIKEERQFITKNGEVLPIERTKKVSVSSVKHLARHSEMITREYEEGDDIVPDKLYNVENYSDYAVYENRFLYMLLNYLKGFIETRISKIAESFNTYKCSFAVSKNIATSKRKISYTININDENRADAFTVENAEAKVLIDKIHREQGFVSMLLMTPLMCEVSKAPMLKPPIIKTNVLKMDDNFKHATELYHFLTTYNKPGYEIKTKNTSFKPLPEEMFDKYCGVMLGEMHLAYEYGNRLTPLLKERFIENEKLAAEKQREAMVKKVEDLKERLRTTGKGLEEYLVALEELNAKLREDGVLLKKARIEIEALKVEREEKVAEIKSLQQVIRDKDDEILIKDRIIDEKEQTVALQKAEFERKITENNVTHEHEKEDLRVQCEKINSEYEQNCMTRINEYEKECAERVETSERECNKKVDEMREYFERSAKEVRMASDKATAEANAKAAECQAEVIAAKSDRDLYIGELVALKQQCGMPVINDYTSEEKFKELESAYVQFLKFFKKQWKVTKKAVRKEFLWKVDEELETETKAKGKAKNERQKAFDMFVAEQNEKDVERKRKEEAEQAAKSEDIRRREEIARAAQTVSKNDSAMQNASGDNAISGNAAFGNAASGNANAVGSEENRVNDNAPENALGNTVDNGLENELENAAATEYMLGCENASGDNVGNDEVNSDSVTSVGNDADGAVAYTDGAHGDVNALNDANDENGGVIK